VISSGVILCWFWEAIRWGCLLIVSLMAGAHKVLCIWSHIPLARYSLSRANDALDDVAAGKVIKALIDPQG